MHPHPLNFFLFFFFNDTATTEIYTLSLHDALPIFEHRVDRVEQSTRAVRISERDAHARELDSEEDRKAPDSFSETRSEEHTSELQSQSNLVCRLLLEKKKKKQTQTLHIVSCKSIHH